MLLKTSFSLAHLFCNVQFEFSLFHNTQQSLEILIFKIEMLLEFQNKTNIDIIGFKLMHFGFALVLSDIDLGNIDLLDTDIPSKPLVSLQDALKTSSRHVFKTSSRNVFKTTSRHLSRRLQDMSSRSLEDVFSVTIFCLLRRIQNVLKDEKLLR